MIRILVVTHGLFGRELVETARLVFGGLEGVRAISLPPDRDIAEMKAELEEAVASAGTDPLVLLSDMYGGSAFMAAARLASGPDRLLVAGANLPLLLDILASRDSGSLEDLRRTVEANRDRYLVIYKEPGR